MKYPNLVVAGAPKCGTTSLYHYLSLHPSVCHSNIKETRYLIDKDYILYPKEINYYNYGIEGYKIFFKDYNPLTHKVIFEATPDYLYQNTAINILSSLSPQPQIIFILRKPSKRIFSLFNYAQNNIAVLSKKINFRQFIKMVMDNDNELKDKPLLRNSIKHSIYFEYLSKWLTKFPKDNIKIIIFEDFIKNPIKHIDNILEQFGIEPGFYNNSNLKKKNTTINIKFTKLQRLKNRMDFSFLPPKLKEELLRYYYLFNTKKNYISNNPNEEYDDVFKFLDSYFTVHNNKLEDEFKLQLTHWQE